MKKKHIILLCTLQFFVLITLLVILGINCYQTTKKHAAHKTLSRTKEDTFSDIIAKKLAAKKIQMINLSAPGNARLLNNPYVRTTYVGTRDNPTIDGGIINSTDWIVVSHDAPTISRKINLQTTIQKKEPKLKLKNNYLVEAKLATDESIKKLLRIAKKDEKFAYVINKASDMKLPANVALIPIIESNYNTNAVSNKGAAGAWQLMKSTSSDYGLKSEDRFQFEKSTDCALALLRDLYQQFGNWELAYSAYNAGSHRVINAIKKDPSATSIQDLALPRETKEYVHKLVDLNKKISDLGQTYYE